MKAPRSQKATLTQLPFYAFESISVDAFRIILKIEQNIFTLMQKPSHTKTQPHTHAIDVWFHNREPYFSRFFFCSLSLVLLLFRVRNHASQICLLIHIGCRLFSRSPPKSIFSVLFLLHQKNIVWAREYNFVRPRKIDWLNYGFSCQPKWRLINRKIYKSFFIRFYVYNLVFHCAAPAYAHQLNVIAFWCVAFVCFVMLNNVSRSWTTLFCIEINYSSKASSFELCGEQNAAQAHSAQKGVVKCLAICLAPSSNQKFTFWRLRVKRNYRFNNKNANETEVIPLLAWRKRTKRFLCCGISCYFFSAALLVSLLTCQKHLAGHGDGGLVTLVVCDFVWSLFGSM